jgi:hypothetical protein
VQIAEARVAAALEAWTPSPARSPGLDGKGAQRLAEQVLVAAGFTIDGRNRRIPNTGVTVSFAATDAVGGRWLFDVAGPFTSHRGGLLRNDTVWKALGRAAALKGRTDRALPVVLLTTDIPRRRSEGDTALRAAGPDTVFDVVDLLSEEGAPACTRTRRPDGRPALSSASGPRTTSPRTCPACDPPQVSLGSGGGS